MIIYKAEKLDGLTKAVLDNASIAFSTQIKGLDPDSIFGRQICKTVGNKEQRTPDTLYPMEDILVSTGWNLNNDIFDNAEAWAARYTPIFHPLNWMHDEKQIIGCITSSIAVDADYNALNDDMAVDELPALYHIKNGSVIYKTWEDPAYQSLVDNIIARIEAGQLFVSMEARFKNFDYGVRRADGSTGVIPRNESTAFLTKYIRQYGGEGYFVSQANGQRYEIGRVLRSISFVGKGVVEQPANPASIIFNKVSAFCSNLGYIETVAENKYTAQNTTENKDMSEVNSDVKRLEAQVADLTAKNESLANQLKALDEKNVKAQVDGLQSELKTRDDKISALNLQLEEMVKTVSELKSRVDAAEKKADEAEDKRKKAQDKVEEMEEEKKDKARLTLLVEKGAPKEKASELVKTFAKFNDEDFNRFVDTLSVAWKSDNGKQDPSTVLDNAKANKHEDPPMSTSTDNANAQTLATASKFIGSFLNYKQTGDK